MAVVMAFLGILSFLSGCGGKKQPAPGGTASGITASGINASGINAPDGGGTDAAAEEYSDEIKALQAVDVPVGELLKCIISDSGNSNGNTDCMTLERGEDGKIYLTVEYSNAYWEPIVTSVYLADDDALDRALAIIKEYNFPAWNDLPEAEEIALDDSILHVGMIFDNTSVGGGEYDDYGFSDYERIPEGGFAAINRFRSCLKQWITDDRLVSMTKEKQD
ncbi:MAG: hypothetical protein IJT56_01470 [Clostridia bacterium]|nr:hypothetical protein [Clostridia bacterium]